MSYVIASRLLASGTVYLGRHGTPTADMHQAIKFPSLEAAQEKILFWKHFGEIGWGPNPEFTWNMQVVVVK